VFEFPHISEAIMRRGSSSFPPDFGTDLLHIWAAANSHFPPTLDPLYILKFFIASFPRGGDRKIDQID
jgi:hypothetical protein